MAYQTLPSELEFPAVRAHVYFAPPRETLRTVLALLPELPEIDYVSHVEISGEISSVAASPAAAVVEIKLTNSKSLVRLAFDAVPLGPAHTRLVIRALPNCLPLSQAHEAVIRSMQAALDKRLTGG